MPFSARKWMIMYRKLNHDYQINKIDHCACNWYALAEPLSKAFNRFISMRAFCSSVIWFSLFPCPITSLWDYCEPCYSWVLLRVGAWEKEWLSTTFSGPFWEEEFGSWKQPHSFNKMTEIKHWVLIIIPPNCSYWGGYYLSYCLLIEFIKQILLNFILYNIFI